MTVLIVTAHPDDAELAMGGTIAKFHNNSIPVTVLCLTVSEKETHARTRRLKAAMESASILNFNLELFDGGKFDQVEDIPRYEIIKYIDYFITLVKPTAIFCHTNNDSHYDHVVVSNCVASASRKTIASLYHFQPNEMRTMEFYSFKPNIFVPIDEYIDLKRKALESFNYDIDNRSFRKLDITSCLENNISLGKMIDSSSAEGFYLIFKRGFDSNL